VRCNWKQHLQRLSPHDLHWPKVDEDLDIAAIIDYNPSWKENQRQKKEFLDPRVTNITSGGHKKSPISFVVF
jgi:hypothetical protein